MNNDRLYISATIGGVWPDKMADAVDFVEACFPVDCDTVRGHDHFKVSAVCRLHNNETRSGFASRVARGAMKANGGPCNVEVGFTQLEPHHTLYVRGEDFYNAEFGGGR